MKYKQSLFLYLLFLVFATIIDLFPIIVMVSSSLKLEEEIYSIPPTIFPRIFTLDHYWNLFSYFRFGEYTLNSMIIALFTTLISTIFGIMAAYGFSRFNFKGASHLLFFIMIIRVFTPVALLFPLYTLMRTFGLLDTTISIILGVSSFQLPFTIWFMKTFFDEFPRSIEEAAMLDGLSRLSCLWKVVIPLSKPGIAVSAVFAFLAGWGDFIFSLSFSQTTRSMPLTIGIANMLTGYKIYWGELMAGGTYMMFMPLVIVIFFQKYIVKGLIAGAIKA